MCDDFNEIYLNINFKHKLIIKELQFNKTRNRLPGWDHIIDVHVFRVEIIMDHRYIFAVYLLNIAVDVYIFVHKLIKFTTH
jgi:hypothetical protein